MGRCRAGTWSDVQALGPGAHPGCFGEGRERTGGSGGGGSHPCGVRVASAEARGERSHGPQRSGPARKTPQSCSLSFWLVGREFR